MSEAEPEALPVTRKPPRSSSPCRTPRKDARDMPSSAHRHPLRQDLFADQALRVLSENSRLLLDLLIHQRLGIRRVVALVMPVPPIAHDIDDNVLLELLPEVVRHLRDANDRLGIIAVYMPDRALYCSRDVRRIVARPRFFRRCRKADLVIDDDVNGPARGIPFQARQIHRFGNNALTCERRVAVDQHGNHTFAVDVARSYPDGRGRYPPRQDRPLLDGSD